MTTTPLDAITVVKAVLVDAGFDVEPTEVWNARALSAEGYIFVEELVGTARHIGFSYRPSVQLTGYSKDGQKAARDLLHSAQVALHAAQGKKFSSGGIHRVITIVTPYRQDIPGLPFGVGRSVAQFDIIFSTLEHWS